MDNNLQKCPICGGNAVLNVSLEDHEAFVMCTDCKASVSKDIGLHRCGQTMLEKIEEVAHEVASMWNAGAAKTTVENKLISMEITEKIKLFANDPDCDMYLNAVADGVDITKGSRKLVDYLDALAGGVILPGSVSDNDSFFMLNILQPSGQVVVLSVEGDEALCLTYPFIKVTQADITDVLNEWWLARNDDSEEQMT